MPKLIKTIKLICLIIITISISIIAYNTSIKNNTYDVNKDGVVNSVDYVLIKKYIMNQK